MYIFSLDVAHPPLPPSRVEQILLDALLRVRNSPELRVLKVIHGYGSKGKGGATKELVRDWAFRQRKHFMAIIDGEVYSILHAATQQLRRVCGPIDDADLDKRNPGITILWVK